MLTDTMPWNDDCQSKFTDYEAAYAQKEDALLKAHVHE
jgi:hypothetical protein